MNEVSKSPLDPRRKKQGFYVLRDRGRMTVVLVDDPPSTRGGKAATPEQIAGMHRRRQEALEAYVAKRDSLRRAAKPRRTA